MQAKRKDAESELFIDVFFTNVIRGNDGYTPYIKDRNWWIGGVDTGILAEGVDGMTPVIGDNENWWIGGRDTGLPSRGKDGYIHPATHPATIITEDDTHRFVTTDDINAWNEGTPQSNCGADAGTLKLGGILLKWGKNKATLNTNTEVRFGEPFSEIPTVVIAPVDGDVTQNTSVSIYEVGKDKFYLNNTERVDLVCHWIAIGK